VGIGAAYRSHQSAPGALGRAATHLIECKHTQGRKREKSAQFNNNWRWRVVATRMIYRWADYLWRRTGIESAACINHSERASARETNESTSSSLLIARVQPDPLAARAHICESIARAATDAV
jgi:hypothetical protein